MIDKPSAALLRAIESSPPKAENDKLDRLRAEASHLSDLQQEEQSLIERLTDVRKAINELRTKKLPDLFTEAGVEKITISAVGNTPPQEAVRTKFYSAGIAASWPQPKKDIGYDYLESIGHGDLIKTSISLDVPREQREAAKELETLIRSKGFTPTVRLSVNTNTLQAWLKEQIETYGIMPDLEKIGGAVGSTVNLKAMKKK